MTPRETAHRQALNGEPWNVLGPFGSFSAAERAGLAEDWGVDSTESWRATIEALADPWPSQGDDAFAVRRAIAACTLGAPVGLEEWIDRIHTAGTDPTTSVAQQVPDDDPSADLDDVRSVGIQNIGVQGDGGELVAHWVAATEAEARRVYAYEALLRERGLLGAHEQVSALDAWDWARGVNLARDGLAAGYCGHATAVSELRRFGMLIRRRYTSWREFGVAFTLGRLLWSYDRYDELTDWGSAVDLDRTLGLQRILTGDPASPWHHLPFEAVATGRSQADDLPPVRAGQVWSCQPGAGPGFYLGDATDRPDGPERAGLRVTVLRVETPWAETLTDGGPGHLGAIVHVAVDGVVLPNPMVPGSVSTSIGHLPITEHALRPSLRELLEQRDPAGLDLTGYRQWAHESGGVFTESLDDAVAAVAQALGSPGTPPPAGE